MLIIVKITKSMARSIQLRIYFSILAVIVPSYFIKVLWSVWCVCATPDIAQNNAKLADNGQWLYIANNCSKDTVWDF